MSVNEQELEHIIQHTEHTKNLELKPQLWDRLESKLDVDKHKKRSNKYRLFSYISSAACVAVLFAAYFHFSPSKQNSKAFIVETLEVPSGHNSVFNVEYVNILNRNTFNCGKC
jgi:plasmid stabilization system protein ParE